MLTAVSLITSVLASRRIEISTLHEHLNALSSLDWSHHTAAVYVREALKLICNEINILCCVFEKHKKFLNKSLLDARKKHKAGGRSVTTAFKDLNKTIQIFDEEYHTEINRAMQRPKQNDGRPTAFITCVGQSVKTHN